VALNSFTSSEAALDRIARMLKLQRKPISGRSDRDLTFDAPLWASFGPNWLALVIYDSGRFWIDEGPGRVLRYDLRSLHALVFCLFGAAMFFSAGLHESIVRALSLAALAFGWLYGMNILLAVARAPGLIRNALGAP
jgi:hypothetical protein